MSNLTCLPADLELVVASPWLEVLLPHPAPAPSSALTSLPASRLTSLSPSAIREYLAGDIELAEAELLNHPQVETGLEHHFAPGIYLREAIMPAGALVIGATHREQGLNICLSGEALVKIDGVVTHIKAPCILRSAAGTRKLAYIIKEMRWLNIHATTETDLAKLEDQLTVKSRAYLDHIKKEQIT